VAIASKQSAPATRVIVRAIVYYVVLIGGATLAWNQIPHGAPMAPSSLDALFGGGPPGVTKGDAVSPLDEVTLAITVGIAMLAAVLLSLPVAWVYLLTRAKRGYQQSVVQMLVILPVVVSGIVLLVKYSVTLAFSLAGIVAAVRFRNTLDDSKDAVYVFLATALGLAAAVNLPVAAVLSIGFNVTVLVLWFTDFGSAPVELEGRIADKRLKRARELARTGTFVARIDDEVFQNMTREQLEGVAERAWRRAAAAGEGDSATATTPVELRLRIVTADVSALRRSIEPRLQEFVKGWRFGSVSTTPEGECVEYVLQLRKKSSPEDLLALVRAAGSSHVIDVELR
jgi:hypothetical protein